MQSTYASQQPSQRIGGSPGIGVPTISSAPTISGTATVGETLSATSGTWTGSPSGYVWVWKRDGVVIPFPWANGFTCRLPANAATEAVTVEVTATNGSGSSSPAASTPTAAVARAYLASDYLAPRGAWSPAIGVISGYAGNTLQLTMDGVTQAFPMDSKGITDIDGVSGTRAWWMARASYTGLGGIMPRVTAIYQQSSATHGTAHLVQALGENGPVYDFNLLRADGLLPVMFNGYNARGFTQAGVAISPSEGGVTPGGNRLSVANNTYAWNTSNHGISMVVEGLTNLGTSTGMTSLFGMVGTNAAYNHTIRVGNLNWSTDKGLGYSLNTTVTTPATPINVFAGRCLISATASTVETIDGIAPATCVVNMRVNNKTDAQSNWTLNTAKVTSSMNLSGNGFSVGCNAAKGAYTGSAFAFYGMAHHANSHVTAANGDQRDASYSSVMKVFGVPVANPTNHIMGIGSSSMTGYAGSTANGMMPRVQDLLGDDVVISNYAHAGSRLNTNILPVAASLAALKKTGVTKNIMVYYAFSADINIPRTAAQIFNDCMTLVTQFKVTSTWDHVFVCTHAVPYFSGDAAKQAELATLNAMVMDPSNMSLYNYVGIDVAGLSVMSDALDLVYFDDGAHFRAENAAASAATLIASTVEPYLA